MLSYYTIWKDKWEDLLIHCIHDVTHITVATSPNWRLMSFNLSHKLFHAISELPLQLSTPNWTGHLFLSGTQEIIVPWFRTLSCRPFLWDGLIWLHTASVLMWDLRQHIYCLNSSKLDPCQSPTVPRHSALSVKCRTGATCHFVRISCQP